MIYASENLCLIKNVKNPAAKYPPDGLMLSVNTSLFNGKTIFSFLSISI